ncbi:hypothetical protein ASF72_17845 [Arthrobacter sp. Leaf141]|uniref:hypothetical protein n=1 Tax=Arthrobacter sp. Leaf141 TaxID=1736273 RepID=UPI0006F8BD38|nr:hypothetical protein [Arthrobacter sp. Leaf141]KQQ99327.1 hypothetical protein ASF72_17845 [Arthrobacter sp. Leaf141]
MENIQLAGTARAGAASPAVAHRAGRFQAALLVAGSCMPVLGAVLLAPILPTLSQVFAGTPGVAILVPLTLTLPALFVALFSPLAGYVADRVGSLGFALGALGIACAVALLAVLVRGPRLVPVSQ